MRRLFPPRHTRLRVSSETFDSGFESSELVTDAAVLRLQLEIGCGLLVLSVLRGELSIAHLSLNELDSSFAGRVQHVLQTSVEINKEVTELRSPTVPRSVLAMAGPWICWAPPPCGGARRPCARAAQLV